MSKQIATISNIDLAYYHILRRMATLNNEDFYDHLTPFYPEGEFAELIKAIRFNNWILTDENIFIPYKILKDVLLKMESLKIIKINEEWDVLKDMGYGYFIEMNNNGELTQSLEEYIVGEYLKYPNIPVSEITSFIMFEVNKIDTNNKIIIYEIEKLNQIGFKLTHKETETVLLEFKDGQIYDKTSNKIIHTYKENDFAYGVCQYIFNERQRGEWLYWDEIVKYADGVDVDDISKKWKKKVSDSIKLININVAKITQSDIIEKNGQEKYRLKL